MGVKEEKARQVRTHVYAPWPCSSKCCGACRHTKCTCPWHRNTCTKQKIFVNCHSTKLTNGAPTSLQIACVCKLAARPLSSRQVACAQSCWCWTATGRQLAPVKPTRCHKSARLTDGAAAMTLAAESCIWGAAAVLHDCSCTCVKNWPSDVTSGPATLQCSTSPRRSPSA